MIESLILADREFSESRDIAPEKVLRPLGTTFREWIEYTTSTELPHWVTWVVIGHNKTFRGRSGNTLLYERHESIELR